MSRSSLFVALALVGCASSPCPPAAAEPAPAVVVEPAPSIAVAPAVLTVAKDQPVAERAASRQRVLVEWQGSYWEAEVIDERDGRFLVTYVGWDSSWDEWVTASRLRGRAIPGGPRSVGDRVLVEWGGSWWEAVVTRADGNRYFIHYEGWAASWDEWVSAARIRGRAEQV